MSRESDSQANHQRYQVMIEDRRIVIARLAEFISQGSKGLTLLNGGAAVAMLGLLQALVDKPPFRAFKPFGVGALALFLIGVLLPSILFALRHRQLFHEFAETGHSDRWRKWVVRLLAAAAVAFVLGSAVAGTGIWLAL